MQLPTLTEMVCWGMLLMFFLIPCFEESAPMEQLSYVLVTPYTIAKSRTGGVLARLLSRLSLELVGAQMFAPTAEFARQYAESVYHTYEGENPKGGRLLSDYILQSFSPSGGRRHRVLMLLFRGENACARISDIAGPLHNEQLTLESTTGETIRDTYADFFTDYNNPDKVVYFEPAVLIPRKEETSLKHMKMLAEFIKDEPNIIDNMSYRHPDRIERTLVIIKPDNWRYASSRPGTIIDMFSRTGLRIISCKVQQMTLNQAMEFYGPVKSMLVRKLAPVYGQQAKKSLEKDFNVQLGDEMYELLTQTVGVQMSIDQYYQVLDFMSGCRPDTCPVEQRDYPGKVKSMVIVYEGEEAVQRIREVLGPTDPTKAPGGTIRRDFGQNIMINTAHASDSLANADREMEIVKIHNNNCADIITSYLQSR